jgi:esterase/lipase
VTFQEAREAIQAVVAAELADPRIDPSRATVLLDHGAPRERVVVLYHGYTNGPPELAELGRRFFDAGANVLIPRFPFHGYRDRMTAALARLTAGELEETALASVCRASGLGSQIHVAGVSLGGLLAAWVGHRVVVTSATAIAPFLALSFIPSTLNDVLAVLLRRLPDRELWWDPVRKLANPEVPLHAYPRFSTHGLAAMFALSRDLQRVSRTAPPLARVSVLVTNAKDHVVSNAAAEALFRRWQREGAQVLQHCFTDIPSRHDLLDPTHHTEPLNRIYGTILDLVTRATELAMTGGHSRSDSRSATSPPREG